MAKSPKNDQGNGKKFQVRQPGEKRNRKIDFDKTEPKKTKFFGENSGGSAGPKSSEKRGFGERPEKPSFGGRSEKPAYGNRPDKPAYGNRSEKPAFGGRSEKPVYNNRPDKPTYGNRSEKPSFGGRSEKPTYGNRPDKPTYGNRSDKPAFGGRDENRRDTPNRGGFVRNERPKFGPDRGPRENNPRFESGAPREEGSRGGFKRSNPRFMEKGGFTGGDQSGKPRFPGDRSARFSKDGDDKKPFSPRESRGGFDKPRSFDKSQGFDRPNRGDRPGGFDRPNNFGDKRASERSQGDRPASGFGKPRSFDKPKEFGNKREFSNPRFSDDGADKKPFNREKPIERDREDRVSKPSISSGVKGLAKFKPRGANSEEIQSEERNTPTQKTYGIPKAERAETPIGFKGSKREYNRVTSNLEKGTEHANSNEIRLNRYIANSGICSRREADDLILQGLVRVNGEIVKELGTKVTPYDVVKVEDRKVVPEKPVYIIMNKPKGFITTTDDPEGRKTVMELIDLPGKERIYPIGRLDRNTTGVLLLTNDGEMAQKLMHPSFEIKKVYRATLDRKPTKEHMMQLVEGVELEDGMMAFEQCGFVEEGKDTVLGIEIKSGRNRIVRRMFEHFGYEVTGLDRVLLGEFDKVKLGRGKWRFLTEKEMNYVDRLKRTKAKKPKA